MEEINQSDIEVFGADSVRIWCFNGPRREYARYTTTNPIVYRSLFPVTLVFHHEKQRCA